jgi:hypothetical protein
MGDGQANIVLKDKNRVEVEYYAQFVTACAMSFNLIETQVVQDGWYVSRQHSFTRTSYHVWESEGKVTNLAYSEFSPFENVKTATRC